MQQTQLEELFVNIGIGLCLVQFKTLKLHLLSEYMFPSHSTRRAPPLLVRLFPAVSKRDLQTKIPK